jgi:hypothetical protein
MREASRGNMMPAIIMYFARIISMIIYYLFFSACSVSMKEASSGSTRPTITIDYLLLLNLFLI